MPCKPDSIKKLVITYGLGTSLLLKTSIPFHDLYPSGAIIAGYLLPTSALSKL
jgi:hypothetical protein